MKFDKKKLPSRHVSVGPERAPHRSYYYAMGLNEDDIGKPFVGVVSTWNEAAPCNIALMTHCDPIGNCDGAKLSWSALSFSNAFFNRLCLSH